MLASDSLLSGSHQRLVAFSDSCHDFAFNMLFVSLKENLLQIPTLKVIGLAFR